MTLRKHTYLLWHHATSRQIIIHNKSYSEVLLPFRADLDFCFVSVPLNRCRLPSLWRVPSVCTSPDCPSFPDLYANLAGRWSGRLAESCGFMNLSSGKMSGGKIRHNISCKIYSALCYHVNLNLFAFCKILGSYGNVLMLSNNIVSTLMLSSVSATCCEVM